ncbi:hypothetical protein HELRODRAFT_188142 [Helobdella robusta]|uniref:F5/8 type C domain-containing protein n=1 Tax=Helobdella robusta TaxID=6412 RepID=T1FPP6_HELRO|nr:hypothetical protein HELRODRAFT_188142 [Helobdella robusta]ESO13173.1 hypothetical protein HELRODRAFT_188142 [Helobdella robusta]
MTLLTRNLTVSRQLIFHFRRFFFLFIFFLLIFIVQPSSGQRTYKNNCQCEYVTDSKCAYTLLLPLDSSQSGTSRTPITCPPPPINSGWADLDGRLNQLRQKLTDLTVWMANSNSSNNNNNNNNNTYTTNNNSNTTTSLPTTSEEKILNMTRTLEQEINDLKSNMTQLGQLLQLLNGSFANMLTNFLNNSNSNNNNNNINNNNNNNSSYFSYFEASISSMLYTVSALDEKTKNLEAAINKITTTINNNNNNPTKTCIRPSLVLTGSAPVDSVKVNATSYFGDTPFSIRMLFVNDSDSFWCPNEPNRVDESIQFDLGRSISVLGVVLRGRSNFNQWVSSYRVEYVDDVTKQWVQLKDEFNIDVQFEGNRDRNTMKINYFSQPIRTQHFKFYPLTSAMNPDGATFSNKCTRLDIIYCPE